MRECLSAAWCVGLGGGSVSVSDAWGGRFRAGSHEFLSWVLLSLWLAFAFSFSFSFSLSLSFCFALFLTLSFAFSFPISLSFSFAPSLSMSRFTPLPAAPLIPPMPPIPALKPPLTIPVLLSASFAKLRSFLSSLCPDIPISLPPPLPPLPLSPPRTPPPRFKPHASSHVRIELRKVTRPPIRAPLGSRGQTAGFASYGSTANGLFCCGMAGPGLCCAIGMLGVLARLLESESELELALELFVACAGLVGGVPPSWGGAMVL